MDVWVGVSALAVAVFTYLRLIEMRLGDREKVEEIRRKLVEAKEKGRELSKEELLRATNEMNKILLRKILFTVPVLLALLWVAGLGEIATPLGKMGAIWWYVVSYIVIAGGVRVGSALQKKAQAGGR